MISAKKAKQLSKINIGEQENRTYSEILEACINGKEAVSIENKFITHSEVQELKELMGYVVSYKNGNTIISWGHK